VTYFFILQDSNMEGWALAQW